MISLTRHKNMPNMLKFLPFPIVSQHAVHLSESEQLRLRALATKLFKALPYKTSNNFQSKKIMSGVGPGPNLFIQDLTDISLSEGSTYEFLQYRMLMLARDGDILGISTPRSKGFEKYCRDTLGLGKTGFLTHEMHGAEGSLASWCWQNAKTMDRLVELAKKHGNLNIHPYIGNSPVWELAHRISGLSDTYVHVAAGLPHITSLVNNKIWFSLLISEAFGKHSIVKSHSVIDSGALAANVAKLAKSYDHLVIKLPDSTGSLGNLLVDSKEVTSLNLPDLEKKLLFLLRGLGWRNQYPLLVSVWKSPVIKSPSVQIWIPSIEQGLPIIEGILEQILLPPQGEFIGAEQSVLPKHWQGRLALEAMQVSFVLQRLGYFGRCSLDAILVGNDLDSASLHWIECNGRWGGTSIPMTLINRLFGNWKSHPFVAIKKSGNYKGLRISTLLSKSAPHLYVPGKNNGGIIILIPNRFEQGAGADFISVASSLSEAKSKADVYMADVLIKP